VPTMSSRPAIFYGWFIVATTFLIALVTAGGRNAFGVFVIPMSEEFGWNRSTISLVAAIGSLINGFSQPLLGQIFDTFGGRKVILVSLAIFGGTTLLLALTFNIVFFIVIFGLLMSMASSGTSLTITSALLSRWFQRKRATVLSLSTAGASAGGLLLVPLAMYVLQRTGRRPPQTTHPHFPGLAFYFTYRPTDALEDSMSQTSAKQSAVPSPQRTTHAEGEPFICEWDNGVKVEAALHQRNRRGEYVVRVWYGTQLVGSANVDLSNLSDRERLHVQCSHLDGQVSNWLAYFMHASDAITAHTQTEADPRWELDVVTLADIRPERKEYLWYPLLPRGAPVILDGDPGAGKSALVIRLIAHLTTGTRFPTLFPAERPE
jgi:Major Facilitator Superfamily/AAA domain